jgi:hypothetical protein
VKSGKFIIQPIFNFIRMKKYFSSNVDSFQDDENFEKKIEKFKMKNKSMIISIEKKNCEWISSITGIETLSYKQFLEGFNFYILIAKVFNIDEKEGLESFKKHGFENDIKFIIICSIDIVKLRIKDNECTEEGMISFLF